MKVFIKYCTCFLFFIFLLGCQVYRLQFDKELPEEDKLPEKFKERIIRLKKIHYKYSDSISFQIINKHENYIFFKLENENHYLHLGHVESWVVFNHKKGIPQLINRITNTKEVGFTGSVNLVIINRVENGDMPLEPGKVIDDDLFRVSGRANYILKEITGEDFGNAGMYATDKELKKLQRKWIKWYNSL
ncbi:MAG: hypothetical protein KGZ81_00685 [Flavobacteriales bacterium]|nr:hypothetical protein [Flavobacteriales bacterium]